MDYNNSEILEIKNWHLTRIRNIFKIIAIIIWKNRINFNLIKVKIIIKGI